MMMEKKKKKKCVYYKIRLNQYIGNDYATS